MGLFMEMPDWEDIKMVYRVGYCLQRVLRLDWAIMEGVGLLCNS